MLFTILVCYLVVIARAELRGARQDTEYFQLSYHSDASCATYAEIGTTFQVNKCLKTGKKSSRRSTYASGDTLTYMVTIKDYYDSDTCKGPYLIGDNLPSGPVDCTSTDNGHYEIARIVTTPSLGPNTALDGTIISVYPSKELCVKNPTHNKFLEQTYLQNGQCYTPSGIGSDLMMVSCTVGGYAMYKTYTSTDGSCSGTATIHRTTDDCKHPKESFLDVYYGYMNFRC